MAPLVVEHKKKVEGSHRILATNIVQLGSDSIFRHLHQSLCDVGLKEPRHHICPLLLKIPIYGLIAPSRPKQFSHCLAQIDVAYYHTPPVTGPDQLGSFSGPVETIL